MLQVSSSYVGAEICILFQFVVVLHGVLAGVSCAAATSEKEVSKRSTVLYADEYLPSSLISSLPKVNGPWLP